MTANRRDGFLKQLLAFVLLLLLVLPFLQKQFGFINEKKLFGSFGQAQAAGGDTLRWSSWYDGSFQAGLNKKTEAGIGFHNSLVRLYNQLQFSIFSKSNAEGVVIGREGECYEEDYLRAATGEFFIGDEVWQQKARQLRAVQDTLERLGKRLLIIIEPGKGTVIPRCFPSPYDKAAGSKNNYLAMLENFSKAGVELLDLNACFRHWADTSRFRLFPRTGTHWSYYGATVAADTFLLRAADWFPGRIKPFNITAIEKSDVLRHPDDDIWLTMNLLMPAPVDDIAYPEISFPARPADAPKLLTIGDSFYFNWQNEKFLLNTFSDSQFWYYNKLIHNHVGGQSGQVADIDFLPEVLKNDLIVIMITERFHQNFAWGFDAQLFEAFYPGKMSRKERFQNDVRIGNLDFKRIYEEAKAKRMPLQERLALEAKFRMFGDWQKHPDLYPDKEDVIEMLMMAIKGSPDWYAMIKQKARERNITDEAMLRIDAEWLYGEKKKSKEKS